MVNLSYNTDNNLIKVKTNGKMSLVEAVSKSQAQEIMRQLGGRKFEMLMGVKSKGVGKDDIRTSLNESLMYLFNPIRMFKIPGFRGIPRDQPEQKQIGTHSSI